MYRGITLANLDRPGKEKALNFFDEAIRAKSRLPGSWMYRGITLAALNRFQEAVASYDRAIEIQPDYEDAWIRRSYSIAELSKLKRFKFLLSSWEKFLKIKPEKAEIWYYHGYTLAKLGRYKESLVSYDKVLDIDSWLTKQPGIIEVGC